MHNCVLISTNSVLYTYYIKTCDQAEAESSQKSDEVSYKENELNL